MIFTNIMRWLSFWKKRQEQDEGYLKIDATKSSFNNLTDSIVSSTLCKTHALVETLSKLIPNKYNDKTYCLEKTIFILLSIWISCFYSYGWTNNL